MKYGVSKDKNKWTARIRVQGKTIRLGNYNSPKEAHEAYKAASIEFHGTFSNVG